MSAFVALVLRGLRRHRLHLGIAALLGLVALAAPLVPEIRRHGESDAETRVATALVLALLWGLVFAVAWGLTALVGPLVERRLSFDLARPIPAALLPAGELVAGLAVLLLGVGLALAPTLLLGGDATTTLDRVVPDDVRVRLLRPALPSGFHEIPWDGRRGLVGPGVTVRPHAPALPRAAALLLGAGAALLLSHLLAFWARSRSRWLLLDVAGAGLLLALGLRLASRLTAALAAGHDSLLLLGVVLGVGASAVALPLAFSVGRVDPSRVHAVQSGILWTVLVAGAGAATVRLDRALEASPGASPAWTWVEPAPSGRSAIVVGPADPMLGLSSVWAIRGPSETDVDSDGIEPRWQRLAPGRVLDSRPAFSPSGRWALWTERHWLPAESWFLWRLRAVDLDHLDRPPLELSGDFRTASFGRDVSSGPASATLEAAFSADESRVAVLGDGEVSVFDLSTGEARSHALPGSDREVLRASLRSLPRDRVELVLSSVRSSRPRWSHLPTGEPPALLQGWVTDLDDGVWTESFRIPFDGYPPRVDPVRPDAILVVDRSSRLLFLDATEDGAVHGEIPRVDGWTPLRRLDGTTVVVARPENAASGAIRSWWITVSRLDGTELWSRRVELPHLSLGGSPAPGRWLLGVSEVPPSEGTQTVRPWLERRLASRREERFGWTIARPGPNWTTLEIDLATGETLERHPGVFPVAAPERPDLLFDGEGRPLRWTSGGLEPLLPGLRGAE